jgi:hypothetical protein
MRRSGKAIGITEFLALLLSLASGCSAGVDASGAAGQASFQTAAGVGTAGIGIGSAAGTGFSAAGVGVSGGPIAGTLALAGSGGSVAGSGGSGGRAQAGTGGVSGSGGAGTAAIGGSGGTAGLAAMGGTGAAGTMAGTGSTSSDGGPADIPQPKGACPEFKQGMVTFNPPMGARMVSMSIGASAQTMSGPLIFYWFATGSSPSEASRGLPLSQVTAAGGIVVAPYDVSGAGTFPWLSQLPQHDALFDEILGCAVQKTKIDVKRIHSLGFSAGALMTTHLSYARSKYMASVATYSGGSTGMFQEMNNKFSAMIMTGGPSDIVVNDFFMSSQAWQTTLKGAGHFAMLCNHGGGHSIPTRLVPGVWQFFVDHPYGKVPSPYAGGKIPSGINPPCVE